MSTTTVGATMTKSGRGKAKGMKVVSWSQKANLQFPIGCIARYLSLYASALVLVHRSLSTVLEYIYAEGLGQRRRDHSEGEDVEAVARWKKDSPLDASESVLGHKEDSPSRGKSRVQPSVTTHSPGWLSNKELGQRRSDHSEGEDVEAVARWKKDSPLDASVSESNATKDMIEDVEEE
ncbi:hypothetical protein ZIOFF_062680 [Zingiber officinale]|uniref:Uncharacterized protein n=1 Tax=Zingiber officinale TaxID=94328 RepID=A0A8J5KJF9_ZINOF|nr:hypothetical protein ZIOFF_062680 [Zingiber officinale]